MSGKVKGKKTFFKTIEKIVDIAIYPIILFSLVCSFFMLVANSENIVTPVFNHTFVRVLSSSMSRYCDEVERSFKKGDVVILRTNTKYKVGDVIAFYSYSDGADNLKLFPLTEYEPKNVPQKDADGNIKRDANGNILYYKNNYSPVLDNQGNVKINTTLLDAINNAKVGETFNYNIENKDYTKVEKPEKRKTVQEVQQGKSVVKFHQIVQIKIDTSGTVFYVTKGTSNGSVDPIVREDFVVGKYTTTPLWITGFIGFCSSLYGMLLLVILPISFVILVESLSILEQINNILLEKKVIARSAMFDTKECERALIGVEMPDIDKIYYYDVMPPDYKEEVYQFLWGCFSKSEDKKQLNMYTTAQTAVAAYDINDLERYYSIWENCFDSKKMKTNIRRIQLKAEEDRYKEVLIEEYQNEMPEEVDVLIDDISDVEKKKQEYQDMIKSIKEDLDTKKKKESTKLPKKPPQKPTITQSAKTIEKPKKPSIKPPRKPPVKKAGDNK